MELDPDDLLDALEALGRKARLGVHRDHDAMQAAIAEAQQLAVGRAEDEPPAILFAFGSRSASFGPAGRLFVRNLTRARAVACGFELEMSEVEFAILHARVALRQIEFLELRGWIAARLRPMGQKSTRLPPRRPR